MKYITLSLNIAKLEDSKFQILDLETGEWIEKNQERYPELISYSDEVTIGKLIRDLRKKITELRTNNKGLNKIYYPDLIKLESDLYSYVEKNPEILL